MESNKIKQILILGSGMMVEPLIDYLLRSPDNRITIGTNMISSAQKIIEKKNNPSLKAQELDVVQDESTLKALIKQSNLVVSYVPPFLHETVAKACLSEKVNMITTSYVSDSLKNLDSKVKDAGLTFMNEIGLDPGIDHLITHKVINEANQKGEKITHYESWCGALCSPEFLDNPLLYKFTWAPRGALLALKNEASQFVNNKKLNLASNELLLNTTDKQFHACFNLEGYFNRDSLTYKELYNLKDAETVIRGTIRFKGFAFIFQCFKHLGMFNDKKVEQTIENWRNYFYLCVLNDKSNKEEILRMEKEYIKKTPEVEFFITEGKDHHLFKAEITFYYELSLLALSKFPSDYINKSGFTNLFKKIYSSLKYLELYEDTNKMKAQHVLDAFAIMLEDRMKLQEWERDLVFMQNEFKLLGKDGRITNKKYDMVVFGRHNNLPYSAISLLVSMPCAITAQLMLDGLIKETGVLRPTNPIIIDKVLKELENEKIYVIEYSDMKAKF